MSTNNKFLKTVALVAASNFLAYGAVSEILRYSDYGPNRGTRYEALEWLSDELKDKTNGNLEVNYFWGGSLVSMAGTMDALSSSVADMGTIIGFASPRALRGYNIGDLPVENSDIWVGLRSLYELSKTNDSIQQQFKEQGITYITNFSTGPVQLICRTEVKTVEDLNGLRIRASGPYAAALTELGALVESMSQADVYQALDSGLLDCNQNYYYSMRAYRQFEVASYVLELDWGQNMAFGVFMSTLSYNRLSENSKTALHEVGSDFIDHFSSVQMNEIENDKAAMISGIDGYNIQVNELSQTDRQLLVEAGNKQIDSWINSATSDGLSAENIFSEYEGLIEKFTHELNEKSYPWER